MLKILDLYKLNARLWASACATKVNQRGFWLPGQGETAIDRTIRQLFIQKIFVVCSLGTVHEMSSKWEPRKNLERVFFELVLSVQSLSHVRLFVIPWITARQASLSITNSRSLLKLMSIESVMPSSHLILGRPLLLLPPNSPSIRVFSNESTLPVRWPKYWSFSFSISPSNWTPRTHLL